jgi:serine protease Do
MNIFLKTKHVAFFGSLAIFALIFIILFGTNYNHVQMPANAQDIVNKSNVSSNNINATDLTLPKLFSKVENSVVQVTTTTISENVLGPLRSGLGSGFIYDKNGHIITNSHVVAPAAAESGSAYNNTDIIVTFQDGTVYNAKLVGSDPFSDVAVLRIENISAAKLEPLPFGNSSQLTIGEQVVAIGNPFGLSGTMTEGIISGLGRIIPSSIESPRIPGDEGQQPSPPFPQNPPPFDDPFRDDIPNIPPLIPPQQGESLAFSIPDIIQTDAAVNPGNSGGPLLNMKGEVIGMNAAIFSTTGAYAGVGFAVPSNTIKKVVPSLIETGSYQHPWLGLSGVDITPDIANALGLGLQDAKGFLVINVNEGSPADNAGIRGGDRVTNINGREIEIGGDIILKIDNQSVRKIDDVLTYLERETRIGDTVQLTVLRDGNLQTIDVTLAARPGSQQQQELPSQQQQRPSLGISGTNVTPAIAKAVNLTQATGFLVIDVIADGPADKAGMRGGYTVANINGTEIELGGDVIIKIDNETVTTLNDILTYLDTKKVGDTVQLTIIRDGKLQTIDVTLAAPSTFEQQQQQQQPFLPPQLPPPIPDGDNSSDRQIPDSSDNLLGDFYDRCTEMLGKQLCDPLFRN